MRRALTKTSRRVEEKSVKAEVGRVFLLKLHFRDEGWQFPFSSSVTPSSWLGVIFLWLSKLFLFTLREILATNWIIRLSSTLSVVAIPSSNIGENVIRNL